MPSEPRISDEILPAHVRPYLALESQASAPYSRFVYEDDAQAQAFRALLFEHGLCDFSQPFGRVLLIGDQVVGMMACLEADPLRERRLRAAVVLARSTELQRHPGVRRRLELARQTLLQPRPGELYLSRIAVNPAHQGRGLGHLLMERLDQEARARGCQAVVLEVALASAVPLALYRACRFEVVDCREARDEESGRALVYVHMRKPLAARAAESGRGVTPAPAHRDRPGRPT
jgi:ribosomal protein S18 acetylase RimI-like enzyme